MILFRKPAALDTFENRYNDFLALVERMPEITRRQVINVTGSPFGEPAYYRILEVYFDDEARMQAALTSGAGQEAGRELSGFGRGAFELLFADVYEESGGKTRTDDTHADA